MQPSRERRLPLLAYGAALALVTVLALSALNPGPITLLKTRANGIAAAQRVLDAGGPPLAGKTASGSYYAIGTTDDQGIYLYGSLLGHVTGQSDPGILVKWIWLALFAVTLFVAPLVYRRLGGSTAAAIAAPAALALVIASFGAADIYWTLPWAVLTLLPWVFLLARRWPRHAWAAVVAIGLLASFATSIRGAAGLPVVLALAYVVFRVPTAWQKRVALVTVLVLSYLAITPLGLSAVRAYRDGDVNRDLDRGRPTSHALWHNTYLGLGFLPNQWRLQYRDELALATVKQTRPHAQFLSSTYIAELRRLFGRAIADDPGYVVKETLQKAVAAIGHTARYLAALVLALTALFVLGRLRSMRRLSLLAAPALLLAVVPPVLVMPIRSYELGLYGAVALLAVSAIAFAAGPALELVRDRRLPPRRAVVRPAVVAAALITTLAATWVAAREIDNRSTAWQAQKLQPPLVP